jgi:predicted PurR-regulated permease PerM
MCRFGMWLALEFVTVKLMNDAAKKTLSALSVGIPFLSLIVGLYLARQPLLITAIGVGVGILIAPMIDKLQKRLHVPRGFGAFLFLLLWLGLITGVGYLVYFLLQGQIGQLLAQFPEISQEAGQRISRLLTRFPTLAASFHKINWAGAAQSALASFEQGIRSGFEVITALVYIIVVSLYIAAHKERYMNSVLSLFPKRHQPKAAVVMKSLASTLRRWFVSQLVAMASVGICAAIGFLIIGVPYWAVLGALTGLLDIIPFVGPTIAAVCALLVTLGSDPSKAVWVIVNFVVVEHIESNLVVPLAMKGGVDLPPVYLLALMFIFGSWFGFIGVLVAPPTLALARTLYLMIYLPSIHAGELKVDQKKAA